jgi:hypothetical protein
MKSFAISLLLNEAMGSAPSFTAWMVSSPGMESLMAAWMSLTLRVLALNWANRTF